MAKKSTSLSSAQAEKLKAGKPTKKSKAKKGSKAEREKAAKTGKSKPIEPLVLPSYLEGVAQASTLFGGVGAADVFAKRLAFIKNDLAKVKAGDIVDANGKGGASGKACFDRLSIRAIKGVAKTSKNGKKELIAFGSSAAANRAKCDNVGFFVIPVKSKPAVSEIVTMFGYGFWYSKAQKAYLTDDKGKGQPKHVNVFANLAGQGLRHALNG